MHCINQEDCDYPTIAMYYNSTLYRCYSIIKQHIMHAAIIINGQPVIMLQHNIV